MMTPALSIFGYPGVWQTHHCPQDVPCPRKSLHHCLSSNTLLALRTWFANNSGSGLSRYFLLLPVPISPGLWTSGMIWKWIRSAKEWCLCLPWNFSKLRCFLTYGFAVTHIGALRKKLETRPSVDVVLPTCWLVAATYMLLNFKTHHIG